MKKKAERVSFANHKGGTGKTTSCLSIAGYLVKSGNKVLVIDFDPQANATSGLGIDVTSLQYSIYDAILGECTGHKGLPVTQVILETNIDNLHVAPSELDLSVAEVLMQSARNRTGILTRILEKVLPLYDYILIDLPPGLGMLWINGICASDQVVVPLDPSIFSLESLENLKISFNDVEQMTGHTINQITTVLIHYDKPNLLPRMLRRHNPSQYVEARLKAAINKLFIVPDSNEFYQAQRRGVPISHIAPHSRAGKVYAAIAKDIINNANNK